MGRGEEEGREEGKVAVGWGGGDTLKVRARGVIIAGTPVHAAGSEEQDDLTAGSYQ